MNKSEYEIEGLTIAITNMDAMLEFYSSVFGIEFEEVKIPNAKLYSGIFGEMKVLFCPERIANINAKENRQQFDIVVKDIKKTIATALKSGGTQIGELVEGEDLKSVGVYDPDKNSIVFKEYKSD